jgi:hypothetical protein
VNILPKIKTFYHIHKPNPLVLIPLGIIWNYFWNSTKIWIKFHWKSWNYCGITGIPLGLLHDEKFQLFPPRTFSEARELFLARGLESSFIKL